MMQTIHKLRMQFAGCLLLALCSGNTLAAEDFVVGGRTGDVLAGSRMVVVKGDYYYVDRQAPIYADWSKAAMTLEELKPGVNVEMQVSPASSEGGLPHITGIRVYAD